MTNQNERPVDKLKIGRVEASIWRNTGENGTYYSAKIHRNYKQGDDYKTASDYTLAHITALKEISSWATQRLIELEQQTTA